LGLSRRSAERWVVTIEAVKMRQALSWGFGVAHLAGTSRSQGHSTIR